MAATFLRHGGSASERSTSSDARMSSTLKSTRSASATSCTAASSTPKGALAAARSHALRTGSGGSALKRPARVRYNFGLQSLSNGRPRQQSSATDATQYAAVSGSR